jgi:MFS transporter, OCT family, solute carrier family 22 (organic cation transporter), member 4/5
MFVVCIFFMSVTGIGQALATSYLTFLVFAFLNAVGTSGVYPLAFIIGKFLELPNHLLFLLCQPSSTGVEMVGRRKREASGIVLNYFYAIGEAAVALAAWLCRDWRTLQLVVSVPPTLFVLYYWLVPESVRWLLAKKRYNKASRIVRKAAAINGVVLSDTILATFCESSDSNSDDVRMQELQFQLRNDSTICCRTIWKASQLEGARSVEKFGTRSRSFVSTR